MRDVIALAVFFIIAAIMWRYAVHEPKEWLKDVLFQKGDRVWWNDPVEPWITRRGTCQEPILLLMRMPAWANNILPRFMWRIFDIRPVIEQVILGADGKTYSIPERELFVLHETKTVEERDEENAENPYLLHGDELARTEAAIKRGEKR